MNKINNLNESQLKVEFFQQEVIYELVKKKYIWLAYVVAIDLSYDIESELINLEYEDLKNRAKIEVSRIFDEKPSDFETLQQIERGI